jgi:hypothetical protein
LSAFLASLAAALAAALAAFLASLTSLPTLARSLRLALALVLAIPTSVFHCLHSKQRNAAGRRTPSFFVPFQISKMKDGFLD